MLSGRDDEERMLEIEKVSFELDDYFVALANKYELTVSALNGVMMARLLRLNVDMGNEDNLYKLLHVVLQKDHKSLDNRNVH
jgi:hypothetical protein